MMSDELAVVLASITPVGELRAGIPLGIIHYSLDWPLVYLLAVIGNIIPVPVIYVALRLIGNRLEKRDDFAGKLLRWRTTRIREKWGTKIERYGFWGVMAIVSIPLPLTGAWTGTIAVWTLGVNARKGFAAVVCGIVIAGSIVTAFTQLGIELISLRVTL